MCSVSQLLLQTHHLAYLQPHLPILLFLKKQAYYYFRAFILSFCLECSSFSSLKSWLLSFKLLSKYCLTNIFTQIIPNNPISEMAPPLLRSLPNLLTCCIFFKSLIINRLLLALPYRTYDSLRIHYYIPHT